MEIQRRASFFLPALFSTQPSRRHHLRSRGAPGSRVFLPYSPSNRAHYCAHSKPRPLPPVAPSIARTFAGSRHHRRDARADLLVRHGDPVPPSPYKREHRVRILNTIPLPPPIPLLLSWFRRILRWKDPGRAPFFFVSGAVQAISSLPTPPTASPQRRRPRARLPPARRPPELLRRLGPASAAAFVLVAGHRYASSRRRGEPRTPRVLLFLPVPLPEASSSPFAGEPRAPSAAAHWVTWRCPVSATSSPHPP